MSKKGSSAQEPTYIERSDKRQNKYLYVEISESQPSVKNWNIQFFESCVWLKSAPVNNDHRQKDTSPFKI